MGYFSITFKLRNSQRYILAGLILVFLCTSNHVQSAQAAEINNIPQIIENVDGNTLSQDPGSSIFGSSLSSLPVSLDIPVKRTYHVSMTAYSSEVGQTDSTPFIAADGSQVYDGMIAANFLKFKTRVRIPALFGNKIFVVHDRMNQRYTDRVDVWMSNTPSAIQFGIKHNVAIEVL